jgi:hypothetical protein
MGLVNEENTGGRGGERMADGVTMRDDGTVVLSIEEYEALLDQIAVLRGLCDAQAEVARGETVSHEEAAAYLLEDQRYAFTRPESGSPDRSGC